MGAQYPKDIDHVASNIITLILRDTSVAFKGNTVAMYLSTAINTRLRIDTEVDTVLVYIPTLHPVVARGPWIRLPLLVIISSVRYNGQAVRLARKSDTAMLT